MKKINKKSFALVAIASLVALGLMSTGLLVAYDLLVSAGRPTDVAFAGRGAWPEHHHFDISMELERGEDNYQTLYAKVKNYKNITVHVQVEFFINPVFGIPTHLTIYTEVAPLSPGNDTELTANFGPLTSGNAGTYDVTTTCLYSLDGGETWIPSDIKAFKFTIVP